MTSLLKALRAGWFITACAASASLLAMPGLIAMSASEPAPPAPESSSSTSPSGSAASAQARPDSSAIGGVDVDERARMRAEAARALRGDAVDPAKALSDAGRPNGRAQEPGQKPGPGGDGAGDGAGGGIAGCSISDGNCFVAHAGGGCNILDCCSAVCFQDPFCCENQWDNICAGAANVICATCGGSGAAHCFEAHPYPACSDDECCEIICDDDPFCCDVEWDNICANAAVIACAECGFDSAGSCYSAHTTPACSDPPCCQMICAADPFCCNNQWDSICANAANVSCECGGLGTGDCFSSHLNPWCNNSEICSMVCFIDYYCCDTAWDGICASLATGWFTCGGVFTGSCFKTHFNEFCDRPTCCAAVCAEDSFCCEQEWDAFCVTGAYFACCPADVSPVPAGNGVVNVDDLLLVINSWGPCPECYQDIIPIGGNGVVNVDELLFLINSWGPCN